MTRAWQVGDVALIDIYDNAPVVGIWTGEFWAWSRGDGPFDGVSHCHRDVNARPVVVIDPEDREQVERLTRAYWATDQDVPTRRGIDNMQAVLREFADPKPPINEPQNYLAAVEDQKGDVWVRQANGLWRSHTSRGPYVVEKAWDDSCTPLAALAVRVLSEGVQPEVSS